MNTFIQFSIVTIFFVYFACVNGIPAPLIESPVPSEDAVGVSGIEGKSEEMETANTFGLAALAAGAAIGSAYGGWGYPGVYGYGHPGLYHHGYGYHYQGVHGYPYY